MSDLSGTSDSSDLIWLQARRDELARVRADLFAKAEAARDLVQAAEARGESNPEAYQSFIVTAAEMKSNLAKEISAKQALDDAIAAQEILNPPPALTWSSPEDRVAWLDRMNSEMIEAYARSVEINDELAALPADYAEKAEAAVTSEELAAVLDKYQPTIDRRVELIVELGQVERDLAAATAALRAALLHDD